MTLKELLELRPPEVGDLVTSRTNIKYKKIVRLTPEKVYLVGLDDKYDDWTYYQFYEYFRILSPDEIERLKAEQI
jgi:hypothetical protein